MDVFIMRHGIAEDGSPTGHDRHRALTGPGRAQVERVAISLVAMGETPTEIISSPLVRARETAEAVIRTIAMRPGRWEGGEVAVRDEASPGGDLTGLVRELAAEPSRSLARRVLLIGHEPDLSALVHQLTGTPLGQPFERALVAGLAPLASGQFRLRFVLDPRSLRDHESEQN